jgi:hypothetical protein
VTQTIVTTTEASVNVPGFSALPAQQQDDLVASATAAINGYCGRVFPLTQHDELYEPENTRTVRLKEYPVVDVLRLCTGLASVITIRCTAPTASRANTKLTFTGQGSSLAITGLSLTSVISGVVSTVPFLFSTYLTVGDLATAINAMPNWSAAIGTTTIPNSQSFSLWATADLNADLGAKGALSGGAAYWAFPRELSVYDTNFKSGTITIHEDLYPTRRYPERMYAASGQFGSVRCIYLAGYNNDSNVGPITMPDDLKRAAFMLIQAVTQRTSTGLLKSESISQRKVEFADVMSGSISLVSDILNNHRRRRLT